MAETQGPGGTQADQSPRRKEPRRQDPQHSDPRKHAAELLAQADRLTHLAREMRQEARRLNAALGVPPPRPSDPDRRDGQRRFAPAGQSREPVGPGSGRTPEEFPISDGARLMITNLATTGTSREEILAVMRDELGLENAAGILDRLRL
jgi:hypothetical protein